MQPDPFDGLTAFLAVGRHKSFTAAAAELGITPTALSKKIKGLEHRLGVVLFQRTTRRVALTEAGSSLFGRLRPAASEIVDAVAALGGYRDRPSGTLRLTVPRVAAPLVLEPLIPRMRREYPDVTIEISLNDAMVDLVAGGYDAGIRVGDSVEKDMIAVRLTADTAWSVVGAPSYFERMGRPRTPEDLASHEAIRQRMLTSNVVYRWELSRGKRDFTVDVAGGLVVDDVSLMIAFAREGLGLAYVPDHVVLQELADGRLERTLEPYLRKGPGLFLYFPSRTQTQPKLRALIDMASALSAPPGGSGRRPARRSARASR